MSTTTDYSSHVTCTVCGQPMLFTEYENHEHPEISAERLDALVKSQNGHTHIGRCTLPDEPLFVRRDAENALLAEGWVWNNERADWFRSDGVRGRLCWQPDYCNPDDTEHGTRWFLTRPYNLGTIPVLPQE